jgi:hypothetical protein
MDGGDDYIKIESAAATTSTLQPHWGQNLTGLLIAWACRTLLLGFTVGTVFSVGLFLGADGDFPCAKVLWRFSFSAVMKGIPRRDFQQSQISQLNTLSGWAS